MGNRIRLKTLKRRLTSAQWLRRQRKQLKRKLTEPIRLMNRDSTWTQKD